MANVEGHSFIERRAILAELVEHDGHKLNEVSRRLREQGIVVGSGALGRYWKSVQDRLRKGDLILMEIIRGIIAEKTTAARMAGAPEEASNTR